MSKTYQISSSDLEIYVDSAEATSEKHPLSNWLSLQSQIYVEGIHELHSTLNQNPAPDIEQIRKDNAAKLLRDLERVSKRQDLNNSRVQIPEFKQEFYEELSKPIAERSQEYNNFIQACCDELKPSRHLPEVIAAQALQKLDEPNLDFGDFKQSFEKNIRKYKDPYKAQTTADHNRGAILYKGPDGKTRHLTVEELMNSEEVNLSGEQRDFVQSSWQQGSFFCGWFNGLPQSARMQGANDTRNLVPYNSPNFTQTFIDASDGNVKVYNRLEASLIDVESMEIKPFFESSVTVDITTLDGDQFAPGIASAKPKISFDITELDESITLSIPNTLKTSSKDKNISEYIKQEAAVGYIYMLENDIEKDRAWNSIESLMGAENASDYIIKNMDLNKLSIDDVEILAKTPPKNIKPSRKKLLANRINELTVEQKGNELDPGQFAKAVEIFNKFESNNNIRRGFAEQKLDEYLSAQTSSTLNDKELNYIKNGIISIMSPSCSSDAERTALKDNAEKIIRQCASDKNQKMSFSQKWQKFKDTISDIGNWLIGRENKARNLMKENPGIVTKVSKHLSSEGSTKTKPPSAKKAKLGGPSI